MTPRRPLGRQIATLGAINLVVLAGILLAFVTLQFGGRPEGWILGPARDHLMGIGQQFALELGQSNSVSELLDRYGREHNATFYLSTPLGESFTGTPIEFPSELERYMRPKGPPPQARMRIPPRDPVFFTSSPTGYWVGVRIPILLRGQPEQRPGILLIRSESLFNSGLFFNYAAWLALIAAVVGASLLCWLPFVRSITGTIRQLSQATEQIATGNFKASVPSDRPDELGLLGTRIHQMAGSLSGYVLGQKRFLGDIAHELSAPIARLQFAVGILEQHADERQLRHLETVRQELEEMASLTGELLSFSKAGFEAMKTPLTPILVAPLLQRVAAKDGAGKASVEVPQALHVLANEAMLERAVSNLVRNAVRYAGDAGPISIEATGEGTWATLSISDCGPGLPEEELERVFTPFYRPEEARTRETGGTGLGLAIVKSCIEACHGTIECRNVKPHGLEVRIRLALPIA